MIKTIQQRINESYSYIRIGNRGHQNCIRLNPSASLKHTFKSPFGRADIMTPADFQIYEVMKSETDKRFATKNYPSIFKVNKVRI